MLLMPIMIIPMVLTWLLAVALLGGGGYLFWEWYTGAVVGTWYLVVSLASLTLALAGRPIMLLLFGRNGADTPHGTRTGEIRRIQRPDGTELQVELYGSPDAQPIVMTHGWGTDSTEWYYAKLALAERFRVIVWDLPGLGKSQQRRNRNYRLEQLADDLNAVVAQADGKPVILIGHSIGGMITLTFCRLFAHELRTKVRGLVLVHTTYINPVNTTTLSGLMRVLQKPVFTPLLYVMIGLSPLFWL